MSNQILRWFSLKSVLLVNRLDRLYVTMVNNSRADCRGTVGGACMDYSLAHANLFFDETQKYDGASNKLKRDREYTACTRR